MSYSKEYYQEHKEKLKGASRKYREKNRAKYNARARERYNSLSEEEREKHRQQMRDNRAKNLEKSRIQYRIDYCKRKLNVFSNRLFMLKMVDTWDSSDYRLSDELSKKIRKYENMIKELEELKNGTEIEQ